jgi:hypothetical protein
LNFIPKIEYIELIDGLPKVLLFDNPPEGDPFNESTNVKSSVTKSSNGNKQTQFNYIEEKLTLDFIFQSEDTKKAFQDFIEKHGYRGGKFNYFSSSDEVEFEEYTLTSKSVGFGRPIPSAIPGEFEHDFSFGIERVKYNV